MCIRANVHIRASVSRDSSIKKDAIHIHATSTKIDTRFILHKINNVYRDYVSLDFWSAADKDKAPDSSNDTIHTQLAH